MFDRADLDAYLGRPATDNAPVDRVEALYCRVSGLTGQESSLADREKMLRESATGVVYRVYKGSRSGVREMRAGLDRMLDDAAEGHFTVVWVVWRDRLARFGVAWIERYVSVVGVTLEVLREHGDTSVGEELMDDFMAFAGVVFGPVLSVAVEAESTRSSPRCGSTVGGGVTR